MNAVCPAPRRLLLVAVLAVGCGSPAASSPQPSIAPPSGVPSDSPTPAAADATSSVAAPTAAATVPPGELVFSRYDTAIGDEGPFLGAALMRPDGTGERVLRLPTEVADTSATWSRDGSRLLVNTYTPPAGGGPAVMNVDGTGYTAIKEVVEGLDLNCSDWSPDGASAICQGGWPNPAHDGIYRVTIPDGSLERLTTSPFHYTEGTAGSCGGGENRARYSPDGSQVAFIRQRCGGGPNPSADESAAIELMASDGSGLRELVPQCRVRSHAGSQLSWSPDGASIAFGSQEGELYLVDVATGDTTHVGIPASVGSRFALGPEWSPDGTRLVFSMFLDATGSTDLYTINPDGSDLLQITDTPGCELWTRWGPSTAP